MANKNKFQEIRVENTAATRFMLLTLKEHHQQHGEETWIPVPDLAQAMGSSPDAVDRIVREVAEAQSLLVESCRLHGFTDERYKRGNEKGWWTCVRLLPPEIVAKRKRAIEERRAKLERAAFLVNEAFRIAYGDRLKFHAVAHDDGSVEVTGLEEDAGEVLDLILQADPAKDGAKGRKSAASGKSSSASHSR